MNNIKELMDRSGLQRKELASLCGVSLPTITDWCKGRKNPTGKNLVRLSEIFNVSNGVILGYDPSPKKIYVLESDVIPIRNNVVPIVGTIACGTPITAEQNIDGYADLPEGIRADFALRCLGDSMTPTFNDGDIVLLRQQPDVEDGQIAAVLIDGAATLKHVYHEPEGLLLVADNPAFAPIHVNPTAEEYSVIQGRAVGYTRMFK